MTAKALAWLLTSRRNMWIATGMLLAAVAAILVIPNAAYAAWWHLTHDPSEQAVTVAAAEPTPAPEPQRPWWDRDDSVSTDAPTMTPGGTSWWADADDPDPASTTPAPTTVDEEPTTRTEGPPADDEPVTMAPGMLAPAGEATEVAEAFTNLYLRGATIPTGQWLPLITPLVTDDLADDLATVDPADLPTGTVDTVSLGVVDGDTATVEVATTDSDTYTVTLTHDARWQAAGITE